MNNLKLCIIFRTLFIILFISVPLQSCSIDNDLDHHSKSDYLVDTASRTAASYPENSDNPYDGIGKLYALISMKYLDQGLISTTVEATISKVEAIAILEKDYLLFRPINYESPDTVLINTIIPLQWDSNYDIDGTGILSSYCKISLTSFLDSLRDYKNMEKEVEEICDFIINYEESVLEDNTLSPLERSVILSTTSVARHAFYFAKRKRKKNTDRDWEISWGNIYAGIEGSKENSAKAIIMAVAVGIITNK